MSAEIRDLLRKPYVKLILDDTNGEETQMKLEGDRSISPSLTGIISWCADQAQEIAINGEKYLCDPEGDFEVCSLTLSEGDAPGSIKFSAHFGESGVGKDDEPMSLSKQILVILMARISDRFGLVQ